MTAVETLFDYLRTIQDAQNYVAPDKCENLSVEDLIALTSISRHLCGLEPDKANILAIEVEWNGVSEEVYAKTTRKIIDVCYIFTETYRANKELFDNQCSSEHIYYLINEKVKAEFYFIIKNADKEINKWREIYQKYNDITRIYNSRGCHRDQEEDLRIIEMYREDLYDMVGHPVDLKYVNEEHDKAYETMRQKEIEKVEIEDSIRKRINELRTIVDSNVFDTICGYADSLASAFMSDVESIVPEDAQNCISDSLPTSDANQTRSAQEPEQKRGRGRPSKNEVYSNAEITNFKSCFIDESYYNQVVGEIKKEPANSIKGDLSRCICELLIKSNKLKSEIRSTKELAGFMINELGYYFHISSGFSSYKYEIDTNTENDWKLRLSVKE